MHFITVMCMKNLQAIILGFLKNSEFFNFKIKTLKKKPFNMFINMYVSVAIVVSTIPIPVLYILPLIL